MSRFLAWSIGWRYTRAKTGSFFISFISLVSLLGLALGVMVLITVMSVMNGFDEQIQQTVFSRVPSVTVTSVTGSFPEEASYLSKLQHRDEVAFAEPFISGEGLFQVDGANTPVYIQGVEPSFGDHILSLSDSMLQGSLEALIAGKYAVVIGQGVAMKLGVTLGDKVLLVTTQLNTSPIGLTPRIKQLTIAGIFHVSGSFGYDDNLVLMNLNDAMTLFKMPDQISGYQLHLKQPFQASQFSQSLYNSLNSDVVVTDWTRQYGNFFKAVQMEKTMMFLILLLIVAVAAFNLVSSLVMVVNAKQGEIAILRSYGASIGTVMRIFIVQGVLIGGMGTLLGVVLGALLASHVTECVAFLERLANTHFVSADIYFVDYLPSKLVASDVVIVSLVAMVLSFLATLYPAWRASRVEPAQALRHE